MQRRIEVREHPIQLENGEPLPKRYCQQPHPIIDSPNFCMECPLGSKQEYRNNKAEATRREQTASVVVTGAGPDDLTRVKLIVISDHPGTYEAEARRAYPMFDNRLRERDTDVAGRMNAGALIRDALQGMFGLDTYTDVWMTNAVRCNPQEHTIQVQYLRTCTTHWGRPEMSALDEHCPQAPVLVAGNYAFKSLEYLYKEDWKQLKEYGLSGCRRRKDLRVGPLKRPLVVTVNPAGPARSDVIKETQVRPTSTGVKIIAAEPIRPPVYGSPMWMFGQDLAILGNFIQPH